jgi:hypothetical protein
MEEQIQQLRGMFPFLDEATIRDMVAQRSPQPEVDAVPLPEEARPEEATRPPTGPETFQPVDVRRLDPKRFGPVPEYSPSQLIRPVGAIGGIFEEVGKIILEAGGQAAVATGQAKDIEEARRTYAEVLPGMGKPSEAAKALKPKTISAIESFTRGIEEDTDKGIVQNAMTEAGNIIGGLATFAFRDLVPILPTSQRTLSQQFESAREAGQEFAAGAPVAVGYLGALGKAAATGDTNTVSQLITTRPVTFALTVYPLIKQGVIKAIDPAVKAWVEKTAGSYYAQHGAPGKVRTAAARAKRVVDDPLRQPTRPQTEEVLSEARLKQRRAQRAIEEAETVPTPEQPRPLTPEGQVPGAVEAVVRERGAQGPAGDVFEVGKVPTERRPARAGLTQPEITEMTAEGFGALERGRGAGVETRAELTRQAQLSPETTGGFAVEATRAVEGAPVTTTEVAIGRRPTRAEVVVEGNKVVLNPKGSTAPELSTNIFDAQRRLDAAAAKLRRSQKDVTQRFTAGELEVVARDLELVRDQTVTSEAVPKVLEEYALQREVAKQKLIPPEARTIVEDAVAALENNLSQRVGPRLGPSEKIGAASREPFQIPREVREAVQVATVDAILDNQRYYIYGREGFNAVAKQLAAETGMGLGRTKKVLGKIRDSYRLGIPDDVVITGPKFREGYNLSELISRVTTKNPQFMADVALQQANKIIGDFVFNQSIRAGLRSRGIFKGRPLDAGGTYTGTAGELALALTERMNKNLPPPTLIEADAGTIQSVINEFQKSGDPRFQRMGEYLSNYVEIGRVSPSKGINAFQQGKIVSGPTYMDSGFYAAFEPLVKGVNRMRPGEALFGNWKGSVTARNLKSGMNNYNSNVLLETLDYGDPSLLIRAGGRGVLEAAKSFPGIGQFLQLVLDNTNQMGFGNFTKTAYARFRTNKPANAVEANLFEAMREAGVTDTSLIDTELAVMSKDPAVKIAETLEQKVLRGRTDRPSRMVNRVIKDQDNFYKFGDEYFKFRSAYLEAVRINKMLVQLKDGNYLSIRVSPNLIADITKVGNKFEYQIRGAGKETRGVLTGDQITQLSARAGKTAADAKFVDYGRRPLFINKLEELRYGPFGGPLIAPFLTWKYKVMDIPFVKKGVVSALNSDPVVGTNDFGLFVQSQGNAAARYLRRAAIIEAANNIFDDRDPMVRKALTFDRKGISPADYYVKSDAPTVVFGKDWSSLNFFGPTEQAFESLISTAAMGSEAAFSEEVARRVPSWLGDRPGGTRAVKQARALYRQIARGEINKKAILDLAGYGGSQASDLIESAAIAFETGQGSDIFRTIAQVGLVPIVGQTNYQIATEFVVPIASMLMLDGKTVDEAIRKNPRFNGLNTRAYALTSRNPKTEDFTHQLVRSLLGLGYKAVFLEGGLRSRYPYGKLTALYKDYQNALYRGLRSSMTKKYRAAIKRGATDDELKQLQANHARVMRIYSDEMVKINERMGKIRQSHSPRR